MPPSTRRAKPQKDTDQEGQSDIDTPVSIPTPSRKRRRLNGAAASQSTSNAVTYPPSETAPNIEVIDEVESNETKDTDLLEEGPLSPDKVIQIIQSLRKPNYTTQASIDHANEVHFRDNPNARPAYAKISGRDWTFFVNKKRVIIGRPVEATQRLGSGARSGEAGSAVAPNTDVTFEVDIDLGPDKMVSRVHAEISFDSDTYNWIIQVNGRNGIYLDDLKLGRGAKAALHSGSVINVHETQMMFLTADSDVIVHDMFRKQAWIEQNDGSDEEEEEDSKVSSKTYRRMDILRPAGSPMQDNRHSSQHHASHHSRPHAISSASTHGSAAPVMQPVTPGSARGKDNHLKPRPSPGNIRGMMVEGMEDIDYSLDSAKDLKPPRSYASLIGQAIMASEEQKLTLAKIYDFIKQNYAYYRLNSNIGWQNSIRHNLSLNKCFEKVARRTDEPGKGMKWQIVPEFRDDFLTKGYSSTRRASNRIGSSGPSSPVGKDTVLTQATERLLGAIGSVEGNGRGTKHAEAMAKSSPRSVTPPLSSFPIANESYTPDRGPRAPNSKAEPSSINGASRTYATSTPNVNRIRENVPSQTSSGASNVKTSTAGLRGLPEAATMSPILSSSMYAEDNRHDSHVFETPLITRQQPRLAPPSTQHVPSHYMLFSSPAPFWKFADLGSTPARPPPFDLSPTKGLSGRDADSTIQSSSPPPHAEGLGIHREPEQSPTRTLSRPASRSHGATLAVSQPLLGVTGGLGAVDEDEEAGIDLAKYVYGDKSRNWVVPEELR